MMQAFRNSAKPLIFIVAISFFAWLVLDLSGLTGGTGLATTTSVGKINGRAVDSRLFQQAVSQATEERQRQSPSPLGIAAMAQIRDQVWEQFIQDRLLEEQYKRFGITTSSDEIAAAIRTSPPPQLTSLPDFQTDAQFDQSKYERWLASAVGQSYIPLLENQYRGQILQAKLARHLVASIYVSDAELWERFKDQNESVKVGMATLEPASAIPDSAISVTPSEIEQWYRGNRESLKREATAFLSFVVLDRRTDASDTTAALERATAIRDEIRGGASFAEVAQRESSDTVSGNRGGDLGEWTRGSFDADFEKAAFSIPLNTVSDPVLTRFGYHVMEITSRSGDKATGRHILVPIELAGAHRDLLDARADSLEALAAERLDPAALDTTARVLGLPIDQSGPIVKNGPSMLPADAGVWAFQAVEGEHSPVVETPGAYFVFRLDSLRAEGIPAMEELRPVIEGRLASQKKMVEARKVAEAILARARESSLSQAATAAGLSYGVIGPFTRLTSQLPAGQATGAAFGLKPSDGPRMVEAQDLIHLIEVMESTGADSAAFTTQLPQLRAQAIQNARALYLRQYLTALRATADIVDHRDRIYKTAAQIEADAPAVPGQPGL
ncbi:MAG: SurA N-terminal domain-containing protein [Gemmatimonadota bacterium]|jgi:peptidyl-prolyl cis-trans isomerase D|nr:SurA N-terminal domain-containing protein [Gemmatimonadota bacterium]